MKNDPFGGAPVVVIYFDNEGTVTSTQEFNMDKFKLSDYQIEQFARALLPDIIAYCESEEGKAEYAKWQTDREEMKAKMMVVMTFEVDADLYQQATEILARQGLSLSDAIEWLFRETVRTGQIPFSYTTEELEYAMKHPCVRLVAESMENETDDC